MIEKWGMKRVFYSQLELAGASRLRCIFSKLEHVLGIQFHVTCLRMPITIKLRITDLIGLKGTLIS